MRGDQGMSKLNKLFAFTAAAAIYLLGARPSQAQSPPPTGTFQPVACGDASSDIAKLGNYDDDGHGFGGTKFADFLAASTFGIAGLQLTVHYHKGDLPGTFGLFQTQFKDDGSAHNR